MDTQIILLNPFIAATADDEFSQPKPVKS